MSEPRKKLGILAYGSLGDDPGVEIGPLVVEKIEGVETPFRVEFSRESRTRGGAPTLVPVSEGGTRVRAGILVLEEHVSETRAADMLWRRETRQEASDEKYEVPSRADTNTVLVCRLEDFERLDVVLYAEIGANIKDPSPRKLAELAIRSVGSNAGRSGRDGISYLMNVKENGLETPLMPDYEREILHITGTKSLAQARKMLVADP